MFGTVTDAATGHQHLGPCTRPVASINYALRKVNMTSVQAVLTKPGNTGYWLCNASEDAFDLYVKSPSKMLVSRAMECRPDGIYIVELPLDFHERMVACFNDLMMAATGTGRTHLLANGSTYVEALGIPNPN
ncbi:hypothetical protein ACHHYP_20735, partial [Achlya hypogyna]